MKKDRKETKTYGEQMSLSDRLINAFALSIIATILFCLLISMIFVDGSKCLLCIYEPLEFWSFWITRIAVVLFFIFHWVQGFRLGFSDGIKWFFGE